MNRLTFYHHVHGKRTHNVFIMHAANHIVVHGGKIKDPHVFSSRIPPCMPDLYYEYQDNGRIYTGVIEVESNPTKESVERKQRQYSETLRGVILTVLSVNDFWKYSGGKADWNLLDKWLDQEIPIG